MWIISIHTIKLFHFNNGIMPIQQHPFKDISVKIFQLYSYSTSIILTSLRIPTLIDSPLAHWIPRSSQEFAPSWSSTLVSSHPIWTGRISREQEGPGAQLHSSPNRIALLNDSVSYLKPTLSTGKYSTRKITAERSGRIRGTVNANVNSWCNSWCRCRMFAMLTFSMLLTWIMSLLG